MSEVQETPKVEVPEVGGQEQIPVEAQKRKSRIKTRRFLDIPNAAELAGYSVRHFRRIIEEERIRIWQIGRKFFILGEDFERWELTKKPGTRSRRERESMEGFLSAALPPLVSSVQAFQSAIKRRYGCDPTNHSCEYLHKNSALAFGMFAFLLHTDLKLQYEDISAIAGIRNVGYVEETFYKFQNRVNFDRNTWIQMREIREASEKDEQDLAKPDEPPASVDFRQELEEALPVKRVVLRFDDPIGEVPAPPHDSEGNSGSDVERIIGALSRAWNRKNGTSRRKGSALRVAASLSEKETFRQILTRANSVREAAAMRGLKPPELIVKCQELGLKDDLDRLLG